MTPTQCISHITMPCSLLYTSTTIESPESWSTASSVNILYGSALDRMEDTMEIARAIIYPQIQSNLYEFDGNETCSPKTISHPLRADLYVITEFYVIDVESAPNTILERPWIHIIKVVPSIYHQLLQYPTPSGTAEI